jgi:hypothetical protein
MNHGTSGAMPQSAGAGGYGRDTMPMPSTPIPSAMAELSHSINELGMLSDSLASRLTGVLMPVRHEPQMKGEGATLAAAPPLTSPTVDELQGYRRRVQSISAQVQDMLNRLEV